MSYLPLARKYRPQTFDELIGQPHVTTTLTRALESKRMAQAYLFAGSRGVGKTSAARILAKCLNCIRGPTAKPCNECPSCVQITQGNSLDVLEIDGASNRGIDEVRSLRESVPFSPTSGPFRLYIIDEVHMLTVEAFNALLKTLEEPPAHVKFIFATTAANKVPSTILSRCQRFDFRRLESSTISTTLGRVAKAERIQVDDPALFAIARAADGSLRDAEVILEQLVSFVKGAISESAVIELLGAIESDLLFAWAEAILNRDPTRALGCLLEPLEQGKDPAQLLVSLLHHVRNLLIICSLREASGRDELVARLIDEAPDRLARLEAQAARSTPQELLFFLQILTGVYELSRRSPMARTILELAVIKLATREQWQSLEEIAQRLEALSRTPARLDAVAPTTDATSKRATATTAAASDPVPTEKLSERPVVSIQASPSVPEELIALWPTFLDQLGAKKMSLAAYLADAKPVHLDGEILTVGLPGFALHQEVLSLTENRRLIDRLLSELAQRRVVVQYATLPAQASDTPAAAKSSATGQPEPPIVKEIVNLFNATILDQPRPAP